MAPPPKPAVPIPDATWPTAEAAANSRLFAPGQLGPLQTRTRTWIPAMVPWRSNPEGFVTQDVLDWYGRFADGRPGVLVVEATGIRDVPSGPLLRIGHDRYLEGLQKLVETVRERSGGTTRLLIQIIDFLAIKRRPEREKFLARFLVVSEALRESLAASPAHSNLATLEEPQLRESLLALPEDEILPLLGERERESLTHGYRERVDDLHLPHIAELPAVLPGLFADAADRAKRAGFCGVELHFAHAYTMASFLSARNLRTDGYGGSPENRVRLPLEVIAAVRARVGKNFGLGCRLLGEEVIEGGSQLPDTRLYATRFAEAGLDFLSISKGGKFEDAKQPKVGAAAYPYTGESGHECMPTVRIGGPGPFGRNLPISRSIREAVHHSGHNTPIVGAGGIADFDLAETALQNGDCDFVGAARQSLADPDWWLKMERGQGASVRRCVFTNYCEALDQKHVEVTCQLWDRHFEQDDPGGGIARSKDGKRRLIAPPNESD